MFPAYIYNGANEERPKGVCSIRIVLRRGATGNDANAPHSRHSLGRGASERTLRITGWQWSAAELPVRVDAVVRRQQHQLTISKSRIRNSTAEPFQFVNTPMLSCTRLVTLFARPAGIRPLNLTTSTSNGVLCASRKTRRQ